jgi:membrane protein DedA with SNARE-associated domain
MSLIENAREYFQAHEGPPAYIALFILIVLGCMGLPFNPDLLLLLAGGLTTLGYFNTAIIIPLAFSAILTGDILTFTLGKRIGHRVLGQLSQHRFFGKIFTVRRIRIARIFIKKKGKKAFFWIRFMPGMRTILFFTSGSLQARYRDFLFYNTISTAIYVPSMILFSQVLIPHLAEWKKVAILLLSILAIGLIVRTKNKLSPLSLKDDE